MEIIISSTIMIISLIIAITIHEFSHAFAADRLGDPTPRSMDRLSLNPLRHLDPIGTLMLVFFHFGWGKPVQIDSYNFRKPKRDELIVALAGPASNLILSIIISIIIRFIPLNIFLKSFLAIIVQYNVMLAIFNLIPIPPLDGSKIFLNLLPLESSTKWAESFDHYGYILLIIFIFLPIYNGQTLISIIMLPTLQFIYHLLIPGF
jgi:Zn-dependent protease